MGDISSSDNNYFNSLEIPGTIDSVSATEVDASASWLLADVAYGLLKEKHFCVIRGRFTCSGLLSIVLSTYLNHTTIEKETACRSAF